VRRAPLVHGIGALLALVVLAGLVRAAPRAADGFPHEKHARLFPVCESCHAGVTADEESAAFPLPADCARCHDGTRAVRVSWSGPLPRPSNLRFSHSGHLERTAAHDDAPSCQSCHARGGVTNRMAVGAAAAEQCMGCHEHRAGQHMDGLVVCSRCHLPLGMASDMSASRIARFPRPAWHEAGDFISTHATTAAPADASCAVCHARETCERCHANADRLPRVRELPRDPRVARLEAGRAPFYPVPASHDAKDWQFAHGGSASAAVAGCANCHTQPSCTGCHLGGTGSAIGIVQALPAPATGAAPGVDPRRITRAVHTDDVKRQHGRLAASGQLLCAQCHAREQCSSCHAAAESRAFHAPNFVERHAVDVFAGRGDCRSCHTTETFCRACHSRAGIAAQSMNASFHDGQPMWILSHGKAARIGLESCASCHRQTDCAQCHSAAGGWGVNPHGPGFTGRGATRSGASCRLCHQGSRAGGQ
jgi:hypothetical protein